MYMYIVCRLQEFLRKYVSKDAVEIISNVLKYSLHNVTAASELPFTPDNETLPVYDMLTISGGMQRLPEQLVKKFLSVSIKHSLHTNHQLVSIARQPRGSYTLRLLRTVTLDGTTSPTDESITVCSRRVVLAIPTPALLKVNWEVLQRPHIRSQLEAVNYHIAVKLYLVYDFPWWKKYLCNVHSYSGSFNSHNYIRSTTGISSYCDGRYQGGDGPALFSDLPLDMTLDFGVSIKTGKAVLLAAFSIHDIWTDLQKLGEPLTQGYHSVSTEVVRHAHIYLSKLYNLSVHEIPTPTDGVIFNWDESPYVSPFHFVKAGVDWKAVWNTISKLSETDDVIITSGSYSKHMSDTWSEYCLESIDEMLNSKF
ncbi:achacin-like [Pecten maximus]|uniref:achacin-like n=1 Tax=Pecten maximus TaxID=6579 RepID=UPI001458956B|nr:achacin-like [Pecten maximus]